MKSKLTAALTVCLAALGLTAGLFAFPAQADNTAGAHNMEDLWALGYRLGVQGIPGANPLGCSNFVVLSYGDTEIPDGQQPIVEFNPDPTYPGCRTPPEQIQANIDAIIATYPPAPRTVTTAVPDITAAPAAPTGTPATPGGTTTVTVTVVDPLVQAQLDALNAKLDALANPAVDARLSALEQRQAVNDARIATLELKAGIIVPEAKNEPPFTNPV